MTSFLHDIGGSQNVVIINKATSPLPNHLFELATAMDAYVYDYIYPAWGIDAHVRADQSCRPHHICVYIFEHADQANALGYHDCLRNGQPYGKVFLQETLALGKNISEPLSHEIAEVLVNGGLNGTALMPNGMLAAREICDPVQGQTFDVDDLPCANFVTPAWFEGWRMPGSTRFDALGLLSAPFELTPQGWMSVMNPVTQEWSELFATQKAETEFRKSKPRLARPFVLRKMHGKQKEDVMPVAN